MARPITEATSITAEITAQDVLKFSENYSAQQLRALQTKLTSTTKDIRSLTQEKYMTGRIANLLSYEQRQLLNDAAALIEPIKTNITHAKEKRARAEKAAEVRRKARQAQAKKIAQAAYPLPFDTPEDLLAILKHALALNRARILDSFYNPDEFNQRLRRYATEQPKLIGWTIEAYRKNSVTSLRSDIRTAVEDYISYSLDEASVENRFHGLQLKLAEDSPSGSATKEEAETLRLWTEVLSQHKPGEESK